MKRTHAVTQGLLAISVTFALAISSPTASAPQKAAEPGSRLPALASALELTTVLDRDAWNQVALFKRQEELKSADKVIADLMTYAKTESVEIGKRDAVRKYEGELVDTMAALKKIDANGRFVYVTGDIPIVFATRDRDLGIVLTGVVSTNTYNTARLSAPARAAEAIRASAIPPLKAFAAFAKVPELKFYGVAVVYGSREFSGTEPSVAESAVFVVPAEQWRAFVAGNLPESDLFDSAEVYLADRDTKAGIKKVKLVVK